MTIRTKPYRLKRSCRRSVFESLEVRELLDGSGMIGEVRSVWSDFDIPENVAVYEIAADDLSTVSLRNAIREAMRTEGDDLIVLHTTQSRNMIAFSSSSQEFYVDVKDKGSLTIVSMGPSGLTINASGLSRIFNIKGGKCQIGGISFVAGSTNTNLAGQISNFGQGGAIANEGELVLARVTVKNCSAYGRSVENSNYTGYFSKGGGIYNSGSLTVIDSEFRDNTAMSSGCNQINQTAFGAGGAIYNDAGTLVLDNTSFHNNMAQSQRVEYQYMQGDRPVTGYTQQQGCGGAIYTEQGTLTITGGVLNGNCAYFGGGINSLGNATTNTTQVLFEHNMAIAEGGAIMASGQNASMTLDHCEFLSNSAKGSGGAVASRVALDLSNCILAGNSAGVNGGALYLYGSYQSGAATNKIDIVNCTITGNQSGTISSGAGGGIYFSGVDEKNCFAELYVKNSIIVGNRVNNRSSSSDDLNIAKKENDERCFGYYSLTTLTAWTQKGNNPEYNAGIPLFVRDYDFNEQVRGDYRLVGVAESQAIDLGYNDYAQDETDFSVKPRINNGRVDIGACEYHPTKFDQAFPNGLSVQEGCSLNLTCKGTDSDHNAITNYKIDLDGDGRFDLTGSSLWISWQELLYRNSTSGFICMAMENSLGEVSDTILVKVAIEEVAPSIAVRKSSVADEQVLILSLAVSRCGRTPRQWTINWGDGSRPTQYNCLTSSITVAHYYDQTSTTETYDIKCCFDNSGQFYHIARHTVSGKQILNGAAVASVLTAEYETELTDFAPDDLDASDSCQTSEFFVILSQEKRSRRIFNVDSDFVALEIASHRPANS